MPTAAPRLSSCTTACLLSSPFLTTHTANPAIGIPSINLAHASPQSSHTDLGPSRMHMTATLTAAELRVFDEAALVLGHALHSPPLGLGKVGAAAD